MHNTLLLAQANPIAQEQVQLVEISASYKGGMAKFFKFIDRHIKYPQPKDKLGTILRVYVDFIVNEDGSIDDNSVKVVRKQVVPFSTMNTSAFETEAIRLMKKCPKWIPAKYKGAPTRQRIVLPIIFKL